ncbi:MAG: S1 RNA-binding domain-containing protein, partial [Flavobacteriales bacterium]|nr:S1 RNA-binding domain-containing protein [Flavobacteriales bacterium]
MSEETKNTEAQAETPESQEVVTETTLVSEEITTAEGTTEAAAVSEETSASEEAIVSEETTEVTQSPEDFLNNFDWHKYEEGIEAVDESQLKEFEKALEGTVGFVNERDVIEGTVIRLTDRDVIIDINSKSEGVISLNEFRYNSGLSVGDKVEVLVDKREDSTGQLILSHKKARVIKAWERVNNAHDTGEVVNGFVKCRTRGGMIVDVFGIEAFLPGSQIDVK